MGACPFCDCGGEIHVSLGGGTFEVHAGCLQQGSVYGMEMRLFRIRFLEARTRILSLLTSTAGGPRVHVAAGRFRFSLTGGLTT
jgi:hypothetical protein